MNAADRLADPRFGNYMLNDLREISLPDPPSYQPQTIGWAILAGIVAIVAIAWILRRYQRWQQNRYRRDALKQLGAIEEAARKSGTRAAALKKLPVLLKQTALAVYPRAEVAPLSGDRWLAFLDDTGKNSDFSEGHGRLLAQLSYQPRENIAQLPAATVNNLFAIARHWIRTHQAPPPKKSSESKAMLVEIKKLLT